MTKDYHIRPSMSLVELMQCKPLLYFIIDFILIFLGQQSRITENWAELFAKSFFFLSVVSTIIACIIWMIKLWQMVTNCPTLLKDKNDEIAVKSTINSFMIHILKSMFPFFNHFIRIGDIYIGNAYLDRTMQSKWCDARGVTLFAWFRPSIESNQIWR